MFQYHGTDSDEPLREEVPIVGNRKPDLRWLPTGKEMNGVYRIGTPLKSSRTPRPKPSPARWRMSMSLARSTQSSSPSGQVV